MKNFTREIKVFKKENDKKALFTIIFERQQCVTREGKETEDFVQVLKVYNKEGKELLEEGMIEYNTNPAVKMKGLVSAFKLSGLFIQITEKELKKQEPKKTEKKEDKKPSTVQVRENKEKQGVELIFEVKPDKSVLTQLKEMGFRWHNANKLWYAKATNERIEFAKALV